MIPAYWMPFHAELVEQDGPALVSVLPYAVAELTAMAVHDGHQLTQLKWDAYKVSVDAYRVIALVLPFEDQT